MSIKLQPHNEEAYKKVKETLKTSNRVAIVHPTGTGKTHISLKLLEENKGKKAIYLAPSLPILHSVKKSIFEEGMTMVDFPNLKRMTYQKLMTLSDEEIAKLGTDIIILDEFHHCGAPEWGKGVNRLIDRNPNATILGLSATPLRYLDGLRDMSDELFDNNVASEMTLEEAIEQGILPEATYVSSLYGYDAELENMQRNISKIEDKDKRDQAQTLFDSLSKKLDENTQNLPELFAEHMKNKSGKYIVFCRNIQDMQEKMAQAEKMFESVNPNITVRGVSSQIRNNAKTLSAFENDNDDGTLKLLYAVDMLNEGYHIRDLDGVIMMRPTYSPTIFTQQLGRALTVGGEKKPLILDLVNNFDSCKIIEDFAERMKQYKGNTRTKSQKEGTESRISIFDKTKEFRDIASKITELSKRKTISLEEKIQIFERFSKTEEELTGSTEFEGYPIGLWAIQIRNSINRMNKGKEKTINPSDEQLDKLSAMGILDRRINSTIDEKIDMLIQWMAKYPDAVIKVKVPESILKGYATSEEEYIALIEEYKNMQRYYDYIKQRKRDQKLTAKQFLKCKEGNVRGIFGYPTQVEELAKRIGASEKDVSYIINHYGTMDNFKELYRKDELSNEDLIFATSIFRNAIDIDLNPNSANYDALYKAITLLGPAHGVVYLYSSENLKEQLETLEPRTKHIIEKRFGLLPNALPMTLESVGSEVGVSKGRIREIEAKAIRSLRHPRRFRKFHYGSTNSYLSHRFGDYCQLISDDERQILEGLEDTVYASDIIYSNHSNDFSHDDAQNVELLKSFELIKNLDGIVAERAKEKINQKGSEESAPVAIPDVPYVPLDDMDLSMRTYNVLKRANINTLGDIVQLTEEELRNIRNMGKNGYEEIMQKLEEHGLTLRAPEIKEKEMPASVVEALYSPIENADFSVRTFNCLVRAGKNTLGDIAQSTEGDLRKIRGMGKSGIEEIKQKLAKYGLTLTLAENVEDLEIQAIKSQSSGDEFLEQVVGYAEKRVEVREKDTKASELEEQYVDQSPKDEHSFDDDDSK